MTKIVIYSTPICPYCERAKQLLKSKNQAFKEVDISEDHNLRMEMLEKSGGKQSVPQIFINDKHIGGSDDLYALEKTGKLDELLK